MELSIYRIVEEALTNALRHGGATHARVTLARIPHALELTVADDGRGATSETGPHDGHGLTGMRERVAMLHGALEVARAPEGGYLVRATLPLDATSERSAAALLRAAS